MKEGLEDGGGTRGRGEERRGEGMCGRSEWKPHHDSEVGSFLPGGWLVFHPSFLTLINT